MINQQASNDDDEIRTLRFRRMLYAGLGLDLCLCVVVLSLDCSLALNGLENTKKYLGFCQSIIGLFLDLILGIAVFASFKTVILVYIVIADVLSLACFVMFILLDLSADIQYYDGQAPLQPAHTRIFFRIYEAYYGCSLALSCYKILGTFLVFKVRSDIRSADDSSGCINVVTRHSSSKNAQETFLGERGPFSQHAIQNNDRASGLKIINPNQDSSQNIPNFPFNNPDNCEKNKENSTKHIKIHESPEKSFHNSPQSSKKFQLPNSQPQLQINSLHDDFQVEPNPHKTLLSDYQRPEFDSMLLETPSQPNTGL